MQVELDKQMGEKGVDNVTSQVFSITLLPCHKAMVRQAAWDSEAEDAKAPELQTVKLIAVEKFRQGSSGDGTLPLS